MTATTTPAPAAAPSEPWRIDFDQLKKDLSWTPGTLSDAMGDHAALYAHYSRIMNEARVAHKNAETLLTIAEARLDKTHRETLMSEYEGTVGADPKSKAKPPTEAQIRSAVVLDPQWIKATIKVTQAHKVWKDAETAVFGFEQRKDMLLQHSRSQLKQEGSTVAFGNRRGNADRDGLLARMQEREKGSL